MPAHQSTRPHRGQSLDVPATIAGSVNVLSAALAYAGLVGRYDSASGSLVIEPCNAGHARRAMLDALERSPFELDPLCQHCGGSGFDGDDACRFCDATGRAL